MTAASGNLGKTRGISGASEKLANMTITSGRSVAKVSVPPPPPPKASVPPLSKAFVPLPLTKASVPSPHLTKASVPPPMKAGGWHGHSEFLGRSQENIPGRAYIRKVAG